MFKKTFTKIVTTMVFTMGLAFVAPIANQFEAPVTTAHADATNLDPDGPWEISAHGLPELQQLHNGNEIYYSIAPNDKNENLFQSAVDNWNALGVIKLVQVNWGDTNSQINMSSTINPTEDDSFTEDGDTTNGTLTDMNGVAMIKQSTINLYDTLSNLPKMNQRVVAQHEIGHALGFDHDNRKLKSNGKKYRNYRFVMNEYDSYAKYYKLGGIEQHMLANHYNLTPSVDLSNMNC